MRKRASSRALRPVCPLWPCGLRVRPRESATPRSAVRQRPAQFDTSTSRWPAVRPEELGSAALTYHRATPRVDTPLVPCGELPHHARLLPPTADVEGTCVR